MAGKKRQKADHILLQALACGATIENAALKAGLGQRTVYRRLAQPEFRERLGRLRAEMIERTAGMLTGAAMGSVKTLVDLQQNQEISPAVRRSAARDVLELGIRFREAADVEGRLALVEELLAKARQGVQEES